MGPGVTRSFLSPPFSSPSALFYPLRTHRRRRQRRNSRPLAVDRRCTERRRHLFLLFACLFVVLRTDDRRCGRADQATNLQLTYSAITPAFSPWGMVGCPPKAPGVTHLPPPDACINKQVRLCREQQAGSL